MERVTAEELRGNADMYTEKGMLLLADLLYQTANTLDDLDKDIAAMEDDIENLEEELLFARFEH